MGCIPDSCISSNDKVPSNMVIAKSSSRQGSVGIDQQQSVDDQDEKNGSDDDFIEWDEIDPVAYRVFGKPFNYGKNQLLYLSLLDNNNISYGIYDIKNKKYNKIIDPNPNSNYSILNDDILSLSSTYCIDEDNNIFYIINNNNELLSFDINKKIFKKENNIKMKTVKTSPDDIIPYNSATVCYNPKNKKIYVLGGTCDDNNNNNNNNIKYVPYSSGIKKKKKKKNDILRYFGRYANTIYVNNKKTAPNSILIAGGLTDCDADNEKELNDDYKGEYDRTGQSIPTSRMSRCEINNDGTFSWFRLSIPRRMYNFGFINYRNTFLFTFGGTAMDKISSHPDEFEIKTISNIYFLDLTLTDNNNNKSDYKKPHWFNLRCSLPVAGNYYATLSLDKKYVDLINLNNKNRNRINMDKLLKWKNTAVPAHPWTEAGKDVLVTKRKKIRKLQPNANVGSASADADDKK